MKKRVITVMLILALGMSVVGCGNKDAATTQNGQVAQASTDKKELESVKDARIKELLGNLQDKGFKLSDVKDATDIDLYAAKSGVTLKIKDEDVEIYNSENFNNSQKSSYTDFDKNGAMSTPNGNVFMAYANDMILMFKQHSDKDNLIKAFKEFKSTVVAEGAKNAEVSTTTDQANGQDKQQADQQSTQQTSGQDAQQSNQQSTPAATSNPEINISNGVVKAVLQKAQSAGLTIDKIAKGGEKLHTVAFKPQEDFTVTISGEKVEVYDCSNYPSQHADFAKKLATEVASSNTMLLSDPSIGGKTSDYYVLYANNTVMIFKSHKQAAKLMQIMQ